MLRISLSQKSYRLLWACFALGVFAALVSSRPALAAPPTAPTATNPPAELDRQWQKAVAKYDPQRNKVLAEVNHTIEAGPFRPDWESLKDYQIPQWYKDAKFGIFIHWGVYSVPAFGNEWYPRNMYVKDSDEYKHHLATYGPQTKFGYKDFIPMFKAASYDPVTWAKLFKDSGAKYVVPVFEHHDGFQMYDSDLSDWTAVKMGPHRDLWGELAKAVRAEGLHLGASSHRVEHNFFMSTARSIDSDVNDPQFAALYGPAHPWLNRPNSPLSADFTYVSKAWTDDWLARNAEIVTKYHPDIMYFDWWIGQAYVRRDLAKFAAFYYDASLKYGDHVGVINYKDDAMQDNSGVLDIERGQLAGIREPHWQTDTSLGIKSWGYIQGETFKSSTFVIDQLADIVSKNGNLLLNIGPKSDGTIPDEVITTLHEVGAWLKVNGDAIHGTHTWKIYGEGPTKVVGGSFHDTDTQAYTAEDFRFTAKGDDIFAIELGWPGGHECVIHSLATGSLDGKKKVASVELLGSGAVSFQQQADGLHLQLPGEAPGKSAFAFRIKVAASE